MASRRLTAAPASAASAAPPCPSDGRTTTTTTGAAAVAAADRGGGDSAVADLLQSLCRLFVATYKGAAHAISSGGEPLRCREHRWLSASVKTPSWCDLCGDFIWGKCTTCYHCLDCKYTCHAGCKHLVVPGSCSPVTAGGASSGDCSRVCLPSGKLLRGDSAQDADETDSGYSGSGQCSLQAAAAQSSAAQSSWDGGTAASVAAASYTRDELCKRIQQYNLKCGFAQFMTLPNKDNVFQGYVQVCLSIVRPVQMSLSTRPPSLRDALRGPQSGRPASMDGPLSTTAVRLPKNAVVSLHVSSVDTVTAVIEMLLRKFKIMDNPHRFTLYEQTVSSDADVRLRRMDRTERPLVNYLTWRTDSYAQIPAAALTAPPNADVSIKRLVLQEDNSGEVVWEAFSIPELLNFLRILEREEKERSDQIKAKYVASKKMLEMRLLKDRPLPQATVAAAAAAVASPAALASNITKRQKKR